MQDLNQKPSLLQLFTWTASGAGMSRVLSSPQFHLLSKPDLNILFLTQCSCLMMDTYMYVSQALADFRK